MRSLLVWHAAFPVQRVLNNSGRISFSKRIFKEKSRRTDSTLRLTTTPMAPTKERYAFLIFNCPAAWPCVTNRFLDEREIWLLP